MKRGWILRGDLRRELPDLDDSEFANLMMRMVVRRRGADPSASFRQIGEQFRIKHQRTHKIYGSAIGRVWQAANQGPAA